MSGDSGERIAVIPLTKRSGEGVLYRRRPEVESQLCEIAVLPQKEIFSRLLLPNRETPGYLYDETLVYMARRASIENDNAAMTEFYGVLNRRFWSLLSRSKRKFETNEDFEDFAQQIEMVLIEKIFDAESDKGDYAQVNFGDFVVTELTSRLRGYHKKVKIEKQFGEIDKDDEEGHGLQLPADGLNDLESREIMQILNALPANIREAATLIYLEGWQVESNDPAEPTVCRHFSVSSRTIRNWLNEAKSMVQAQSGGEQ